MDSQTIRDLNSCGTANNHPAEFSVTLTTPEGVSGITLVKCGTCLIRLLNTPAVKRMGRTATVSAA